MKNIALFVVSAICFGLAPWTTTLDPVLGSLLLVTLGVALALAAGGLNAIAVASGAAGAFAAGVLLPSSTMLAGAALVGFCYVERTLRVRNPMHRAAHVGLALLVGALAGALSGHYLEAGLTVRLVVVVLAAVMVSLPLLIEADDPIAHTLDELANDVPAPAAAALREGAELRRAVDASLLDRQTAKDAHQTWRNLLDLAQTRARLERNRRVRRTAEPPASIRRPPGANDPANDNEALAKPNHSQVVLERLDQKIAEHVSVLARTYAAADDAHAAEASLDDRALRSVETCGESLEQVSKAIVEQV